MSQHQLAWKRRLFFTATAFRCFFVTADARFQPLGVLRFNFFLAINQRLNASLALLCLMRIESVLDPAQSDVQRDAALFPAFNQSPIHRTEHQMLAATANESVFYF